MDIFKLLALFAEGLLSFFSPCVLPILPVYIGILGGQVSSEKIEHSSVQRRILVNTLCFVLGITLTFFVLGFASSLLSRLLTQHMQIIQLIGGLLIIIMGLIQLDLFQTILTKREFSAKHKVYQAGQQVTPLLATLMGFTFSFSWTPCIGPILASAFLYASSHQGIFSVLLISVYCLGFILPFVLVAFFSQKVLAYFKKHQHLMKHTKRISGILLILIGLSIITGQFTTISRFFH
ncbi:cytochrome c biogenesis CcdA family protein [Streptococcus entericus]|uniref:cytochrome c biogenesis CcdA family protein n=1 Tax=Streptococcus entericus TaxID=155680 RepID=UPI0003710567|nr:cytochrome c biogenesis protein CcdA [Streptococcus entericus]